MYGSLGDIWMENKDKTIQEKSKRLSFLIIVSACCLVLLALYFFVFWRANNSSLGLSSKNILNITEKSSTILSNTLKSDIKELDTFAKHIQSTSSSDLDINLAESAKSFSTNPRESTKFENQNHKNSALPCDRIIYVSKDGKSQTLDGKPLNVKSNDLLHNFSKCNYNNTNEQRLFLLGDEIFTCIPININGKNAGVLFGSYFKDSFVKKHLSSTYLEKGYIFIMNSSGEILIDSKNDTVYDLSFPNFFKIVEKSSSNAQYLKQMKADFSNKKSGTKTLYFNNTQFIVAYSPVDNISDWFEIQVVPRSSALENLDYLLFASVLMGTLIIFIFAMLGYRYSKSSIDHLHNIEKLAFTDPVTGHRNFHKFKVDAEKILLKRQKDGKYCLTYLNLIGFKFINETFGYDVGDNVLKNISSLINSIMGDDEIFARVSGDRFVILNKYGLDFQEAEDLLFSLVDKISAIPPLSSSRMRIEIHAGVFVIDGSSDLNINAMMDRAIIALKSIDRSDTSLAVYDDELITDQLEKQEIEQKMDKALMNGEFHVYVQPKYKTSDRTLVAGEALIRWHDPEKGLIPPIQFIPLFEANRFIYNIDRYVLEVVCRFLRRRINENKDIVPISLNVSPVEIMIPGFIESYTSIKNKYEIPDGYIELEFTEGVFFENQVYFKEVIVELKSAGFSCSLDDFGSGYSSLNVLKEMPVDVLKLDRMFFKESDDIVRDRSLIRSVVAMARSLEIKTVAEGVETLDTVEFLKIIGCNMIQGYVYARPMPIDEFERLMDCEGISDYDDFSSDYDKVSEIIPVDKPYDLPIRNTYDIIYEINATTDTYHLYVQENCTLDIDDIDEINDYQETSLHGSIIDKVHKDDINSVSSVLTPENLIPYFQGNECNRELSLDYRRLDKNKEYVWVRCRILKAQNMGDQLVLFLYIKNINDQKHNEELLSTAQTRLSSAFLGTAGLVYEIDINDGGLSMIRNYSKHMIDGFSGDEYDTVYTYIGTHLIHPDYAENFYRECSLPEIRAQFLSNSDKTLCYEYRSRVLREKDEFIWVSVRFSYMPELSSKVLISIQDISDRKQSEELKAARDNLMTRAVKQAYDEILELNLTHNVYTLTKIINKENHEEKYYSGDLQNFLNTILKTQFLHEDKEFLKEIFSPSGLIDIYNNLDVLDFTLNVKKKALDGSFQWYSLYFIPNRTDPPSPDAIMFVYLKNIQAEKDIHDKAFIASRRLNNATDIFDLVCEIDLKSDISNIIGGSSIPQEVIPLAPISYNQLISAVRENFIHSDDLDYFNQSVDKCFLQKQFKENNNQYSLFVRCKIDGVKWISIKYIFDSRSNIATVFIQSIEKK